MREVIALLAGTLAVMLASMLVPSSWRSRAAIVVAVELGTGVLSSPRPRSTVVTVAVLAWLVFVGAAFRPGSTAVRAH